MCTKVRFLRFARKNRCAQRPFSEVLGQNCLSSPRPPKTPYKEGVKPKNPHFGGFCTQLPQKRPKNPQNDQNGHFWPKYPKNGHFMGVFGPTVHQTPPTLKWGFWPNRDPKMGFWYTVGPKRAILPKMGIFDPFWALQNGHFGHFGPTVYQKAPKRGRKTSPNSRPN